MIRLRRTWLTVHGFACLFGLRRCTVCQWAANQPAGSLPRTDRETS